MNSKEFAKLEEELEQNEIDAVRWRKLCEHAYRGEALRALVYAPCGDQEDVTVTLNGWVDDLVIMK